MSRTGGGPGTNQHRVRGVGAQRPPTVTQARIDALASAPRELTEVPTVDLGAIHPASVATWVAIKEIVDIAGSHGWAVVGGQMVAIHAALASRAPPRLTTDGDIVVDIRSSGRQRMTAIANALIDSGFEMQLSPDNVSRFVRGNAKIDLLAPDGVGSTEIMTSPPGRAVQAPGTTQALERSELVTVRWADQELTVRVPALLGAVVAKAAAHSIVSLSVEDRLKHQRDLAFLLEVLANSATVTGPVKLAKTDKRRIRNAVAPWLDNELHPAWTAVSHPPDVIDTVDRLTST